MTFKWSGVFTKDNDRKTLRLDFEAEDEASAATILNEYVEAVNARGWKMESNEVKVGK